MQVTTYHKNGETDSIFECSSYRWKDIGNNFITFYKNNNSCMPHGQAILTTNQNFILETQGRDKKLELEVAGYSQSSWFSVECTSPKKKWGNCLNLISENSGIGFWCDGKRYLIHGTDVKIVGLERV